MWDRFEIRGRLEISNLAITSEVCRADSCRYDPKQKAMFNRAKSLILNPFSILLLWISETSRERRSFAGFIETTPSQNEIRGAHESE
jgi:hypothetical protein